MQAQSPAPKQQSALSVIKELGSESTAHGIAKVATSTKTKRQVMWALLVIAGFTAATLQLSLLVRKYLSFQVVEVSKIRDGLHVEFPSITVCNLAAISLAKARNLLVSEDSELTRWIKFITGFNFGPQAEHLFSFRAFFENLETEAEYLGHSIDDFLLHCRFNQQSCSVNNFTQYFDGSYYNCYTFNSGLNKKKLHIHATGPQNGLSLILSLDNDDVIIGTYGIYNLKDNIASSAGVRVVVHPPNTMPSPVDHGFDVPPGYSTSVGLKPILHTRLSNPYGNCTKNPLPGPGLEQYENTIFSCLQLCKQRVLIRKCGCQSSGLPKMTSQNVTFCGHIRGWQNYTEKGHNHSHIIKLISLQCEEDLLHQLANDRSYEQLCDCYQPCQETSYQKSISLSYWPLEFFQKDALEKLYGKNISQTFIRDAYEFLNYLSNWNRTASSPKPSKDSSSHFEQRLSSKERDLNFRASNLIRQNLVRLNVYLEDLNVVEFSQLPAYELADLFADIGGTLGLWMGISVLTVMELVELITRLIGQLFNSETKINKDAVPIANGNLQHDYNSDYKKDYDFQHNDYDYNEDTLL